MKHLLSFLLIATFVSVFPAQISTWTSVKTIDAGTDVIVIRKSSGRVVGLFVSATDDTVTVNSRVGPVVVDKDNVKKIFNAVARDRKKGVRRGALFGLALGLLAAGVVEGVEPSEGQQTNGLVPFLLGGAVGLWAGDRHGKGKTKGALIYSAN
ncbi:MAG: hypothetical protein ABI857_12605 [Acidobacteriota bacterium]